MTDPYKSYVENCKKKFWQLLNDSNGSGKVLIRYLRHRRGYRTGVIVSWKDASNQVKVGVSKCNTSSGDRWNKYVGLAKAIESAVPVSQVDSLPIPTSAFPDFNHQLERISKYFRVNL